MPVNLQSDNKSNQVVKERPGAEKRATSFPVEQVHRSVARAGGRREKPQVPLKWQRGKGLKECVRGRRETRKARRRSKEKKLKDRLIDHEENKKHPDTHTQRVEFN